MTANDGWDALGVRGGKTLLVHRAGRPGVPLDDWRVAAEISQSGHARGNVGPQIA